jgi:hypothetical protein
MSPRIAALAALLCGASLMAQAATPQQEKMKTCNAQASSQSLKGQARKDYMKSCLSGAEATAAAPQALTAQQEKMKSCNADATSKALNGQARKDFMKSCLSGG